MTMANNNDIVIRVENISKFYKLGLVVNDKLADLISASAEKVVNGIRRLVNSSESDDRTQKSKIKNQKSDMPEYIWALQNVSFELKQGEVLGIIGKNGAGKSTLLKILTGITEPTEGKIWMKGRVGSLLEVGTGFHPELTGRENIYLNGAILGMRRIEITRRLDEIVDFSGVEKFIDTPVKRYSSGMYVRLAFAVAAHFQPEILIVDEVLAVGDIRFQKKCLGKMKSVSSEGRTVLFVSHNMPFITTLCQRCILLESGTIVKDGATSDVVLSYYTDEKLSTFSIDFSNSQKKIGDENAMLLSASVRNKNGQETPEIIINEKFTVIMRYRILKHNNLKLVPNFHFYRDDGVCAFVSHSHVSSVFPLGDYIAECQIPENFLNNGIYFIRMALSSYEPSFKIYFDEPNVLSVNIRDPIEGNITRSGYSGPYPGSVRPLLEWKIFKA